MKLAECRARELAHRETCLQGRAIDKVRPTSGSVIHHSKRPTIWADIPELEGTA
jgi:hypothetical protein